VDVSVAKSIILSLKEISWSKTNIPSEPDEHDDDLSELLVSFISTFVSSSNVCFSVLLINYFSAAANLFLGFDAVRVVVR
jgi:hypothetical protein